MIPLPTNPPELAAFKASVPLTEDLRRIMEEPTLKRAITALKLASVPTCPPSPVPGLHPDTTTAHLWHQCIGMNSVFEQLERMCLKPGEAHPSDVIVEDEFEANLPPELQLKNRPKTL